MEGFVSWLLVVLVGVIAVPTAFLCLEIVASVLRRPVPVRLRRDSRRRVAVLVPARDESPVIALTLGDARAQLGSGDVLLVVADNCTDDTAAIAKMSGADVVERHDSERIGKGYAIDWGLRYLEHDPPDIIVVIDADSRLAEGTIDQLVWTCATTNRPVQALYLMIAPQGSQINKQIAAFAWRIKNWVRPLGLGNLGMPCQLVGTGMAFPWLVIRAADLATGWTVEDLKLGLDLTSAGHPPLFCPSALVTSEFAASTTGADTQRRRWEHGHIMTILKFTPHLLQVALTRGNLSLLALALDLAVPPLSLLTILLLLMFAISGGAALLGFDSTGLRISVACLIGFAIAVILAWIKYGRDVLPPRAILSVPSYILAKLSLYGQILCGKIPTTWIRTDRTKP